MRILLVCDVLGAENNGTTIATMNLVRFLQSKGHDVRILCADQEKRGWANYYIVKNLSLGKLIDRYVQKVGVTLACPQKSVMEEAMADVDLVHVMLPFALGKAAVKLAKQKNLPVTVGFHCQAENFTSYIKMNRLGWINHLVYRYFYRHIYRYADAVHYPTEFIRDEFEKHAGHKTNGYVISNGVNSKVQKKTVAKPTELQNKIVILTTGRYAREKSQDTLLKAVALSRHKDQIQLILAGQGTKEKAYKKLAKRLHLTPIFRLFDRDEIVDVLNYADLYVHPADIELEGIACLEAIACGKLVIVSSSKLSATKGFAVDPRCIFKSRNPRDLARVIDYFIEHPDERAQLADQYLHSAKVFNQTICMEQMENMMKEVYANAKQKQKDCLLPRSGQ